MKKGVGNVQILQIRLSYIYGINKNALLFLAHLTDSIRKCVCKTTTEIVLDTEFKCQLSKKKKVRTNTAHFLKINSSMPQGAYCFITTVFSGLRITCFYTL